MNRVWEIIEHRRDGDHSESGMRSMRKSSYFSGKLSKKEDSEEFKKGVKEGFCAALEMLADVAETLD